MADPKQPSYQKSIRRSGGRDGISSLVTADRARRARELMTPSDPPPTPPTPPRTLVERAAGKATGRQRSS